MVIKLAPEFTVVALAPGGCLQVASMKTAVFTLSTLLNASTAVLVQATVPQAQSKLNNFYLKRKSEPSGSLFLSFFV